MVATSVAPAVATAVAPTARLTLSVAVISAAALAYQVLLMRLLAVPHWYPFAAMVVSLALLGHGFAGTLLALARERWRRQATLAYPLAACAFGVAAPLCFAIAQALPFNGLELVWDARQLGWLTLMYFVLSIPFACAAACFGVVFVAHGARIPALYAADLVGAALGAVLVIGALLVLAPADALRAVALAGLCAALLAWPAGTVARALLAPLLALGVFVALLVPQALLAPRVNPYKGLARALTVPGTAIVAERSGPLGLVHAIESPRIPLRHAPGLSVAATVEPAPQIGLFVDGDGPLPITRRASIADETGRLAYLGQTTSALPYALLERPHVLVLGAGGGTDVLQALTLGAAHVRAVELDPNVIELVQETFAAFAGDLYRDPRVVVVAGDARSALRGAGRSYDLIQLPFAESVGGVRAAADEFLYTVEALRDARARLMPGGIVAATRPETLPPRDSLKLVATAIAALRADGVADPGAHLVAIRGWQTSTLLVARDPFEPEALARVAAFCRRFSFDPAHYSGLAAADANRYNVVDVPWLFDGTRALLGDDPGRFVAGYKFDVRPATDDRPFFHHHFRWASLPELWRLRGAGAAPLLEAGYLLLVATLAQALPLALLLIVAPLALKRLPAPAVSRTRTALYFLLLGVGFLALEIAALSRHTLFIGQPLVAATVVLAALLASAGAGSALAARYRHRPEAAARACALAAGLALLLELVLPLVTGAAATWPLAARVATSVALLAPLGVVLGLPFPLALAALDRDAPALVPWAFAINGCASVIAPLVALLVAIEFGYATVVAGAAACYGAAAWIAWTGRRGGSRRG